MQPISHFTPESPAANRNTIVKAIERYVNIPGHGMHDYQIGAARALARQLSLSMYSTLLFTQSPQNPDHDIVKTVEGGIIVLPPGMGKTYVYGSIVKAINPSADTPIIISTPYVHLNKQVVNELKKVGIDENDIGVFDTNTPASKRTKAIKSAKVIVTCCQSIDRVIERLEKAKKFSPLIIPDEVDFWAIGPKTSKILKAQRPRSILVGFTATEGGACKELFENQAPLYHKTYVESIVGNNLCEGVRTHVADISLGEDWAKRLQALEKSEKGDAEIRKEDEEKFSQHDATLSTALYNHFTHHDPDMGSIYKHRSFFFVRGVKAAEDGAKAFNALAESLGVGDQVKAAHITHKTPKSEVAEILSDFKAGKITALFSDRILSRGVDVTDGVVVHNLRLSKKESVVTQMLGRVTRKQGEHFSTQYGRNKVAVAFSYRLAGTNPVLFGELLEGMPEVYADRYQPKEEEKEKSESLVIPQAFLDAVHRTATFYTNTHEVAELISNARAIRDGSPLKDSGMLNKFNYASKLHVNIDNSVFLEFWNSIQRRYRENPSAKIYLDNEEIECGYFRVPKRGKEFCIHSKHLELFSRHIDAALSHYKPMGYFIDAINGPDVEEAVRARWQMMADEYAKADNNMLETFNEREIHIGGKVFYARLPVFGQLPFDLQLDVKAQKAFTTEISQILSPIKIDNRDSTIIRDGAQAVKNAFAEAVGVAPDNLYFGYVWNQLNLLAQTQPSGIVLWKGFEIGYHLEMDKNPPVLAIETKAIDELQQVFKNPQNQFVSVPKLIEKATGDRALYDSHFGTFYEELTQKYLKQLPPDLIHSAEAITKEEISRSKPLTAEFVHPVRVEGQTFLTYMYHGDLHVQKHSAERMPLTPLKMANIYDIKKMFGVKGESNLHNLKEMFGQVQASYGKKHDGQKGPMMECAWHITIGGETIASFWGYIDPKENENTYIDVTDMAKVARILAKKNIISPEEAQKYQTGTEAGNGVSNALIKRPPGRPRKDISPEGIKGSKGDDGLER